jgi:carbamoylphosphate synthase large subunit
MGFLRTVQDLALPVPDTKRYLDRSELASDLDSRRLRLPAVFKPTNWAGGAGVRVVESRQDADGISYSPVLVQNTSRAKT